VPFPEFSSQVPFAYNSIVCLFWLPPATDVLVAFLLYRQIQRRRFREREARISFLLFWSGLFYCQALARTDLHHLLIALPPWFVLSACAWGVVWERLGEGFGNSLPSAPALTVTRWLLSGLAAGAIAGFLLFTRPVFLPKTSSTEKIPLERAGVRAEGGERLAAFVRGVQRRAPADRSILCLPYVPMFYFLCERRNPTRWNYLWPGDQTPEDHETLVREVKNDPPAVVVVTVERGLRRYAPSILEYVHAEYVKAEDFYGLAVYLPKSGSATAFPARGRQVQPVGRVKD
jgi:hypothetical protein